MAGQSDTGAHAAWTLRNEDSVSVCSETSHTIINIPDDELQRRYMANENTPIRFRQSIRNSGIISTHPKARKVAYSAGALLLLVIVGGAFGIVYSSYGGGSKDGGRGNDISYQHVYIEHKSAAAAALMHDTEDHELAKPDLQEDKPQLEIAAADSPSRGSTPLKSSSGNVFIPARQNPSMPVLQTVKREEDSPSSPAPAPSVTTEAQPISSSAGGDNNAANTTRKAKPKKTKVDGYGISHYKMTLPADADTKHAVGLLYEMKLIPSGQKVNCVGRFTECVHDFDGKKIYKGWKAAISVNATIAGISEDQNTFIGYGKDKKLAKQMAAQYAIMAIYPGSITYTVDPKNEASEIKQFCEGRKEDINKECN